MFRYFTKTQPTVLTIKCDPLKPLKSKKSKYLVYKTFIPQSFI